MNLTEPKMWIDKSLKMIELAPNVWLHEPYAACGTGWVCSEQLSVAAGLLLGWAIPWHKAWFSHVTSPWSSCWATVCFVPSVMKVWPSSPPHQFLCCSCHVHVSGNFESQKIGVPGRSPMALWADGRTSSSSSWKGIPGRKPVLYRPIKPSHIPDHSGMHC